MGLLMLLSGWEFVCKDDAYYARTKLRFNNKKLPKWIRIKLFPYASDVEYYLKGNHFKYKIRVTRPGEQGSAFIYEVFRKKRK